MSSSRRIILPHRSSILFLIGICGAVGISLGMEGIDFNIRQNSVVQRLLSATPTYLPAAQSALSDVEMEYANIAWQYFENQVQPTTGLANSVADYPSTTLWDQAGYVFAMVSAHKLGIIEDKELEARAKQLLQSFASMRLYDNKLPNKAYHTISLEIVDYTNQVHEDGIGWSALDIGRFLLSLRALENSYPLLGPDIREIVANWELRAIADNGELFGMSIINGSPQLKQEGRIGYEQYGARAAALWGVDVNQALSVRDELSWHEIFDVSVPRDARTFAHYRTINPTLSEPYFLEAIELGLTDESALMASRVFEVQEARFEETGIATMVSEDHLSLEPYFAYSSIIANGNEWAVVNDRGDRLDDLRTLSLKSLFAWNAIYKADYTQGLIEDFVFENDDLISPENGWYAGIYEESGDINDALSLNTNAVILEALYYQAHGPFWQF